MAEVSVGVDEIAAPQRVEARVIVNREEEMRGIMERQRGYKRQPLAREIDVMAAGEGVTMDSEARYLCLGLAQLVAKLREETKIDKDGKIGMTIYQAEKDELARLLAGRKGQNLDFGVLVAEINEGKLRVPRVRTLEEVAWEYEEAAKEVGMVELHSHVEGVLGPKKLREIAQKHGVRLGETDADDEETWKYVDRSMGGEEKATDLWSFFGKLSTPNMKCSEAGVIMNALKSKGVLADGKLDSGKLNSLSEEEKKEIVSEARGLIRSYLVANLEEAQRNGVRYWEALFSPLAMTADGDMKKVEWMGMEKAPEGLKTMIEQWNGMAAELIAAGVVPRIEDYVGELSRAREEAGWKSQKEFFGSGGEGRAMAGRLCVRREKPSESENLVGELGENINDEMAERMVAMYKRGEINGVDIAGFENLYLRGLPFFGEFVKKLVDAGVPFTFHAGELSYDETNEYLKTDSGELSELNKSQDPKVKERAEAAAKMIFNFETAYENLKFAIESGAKRIGHAVMLFPVYDPARLGEYRPEVQELIKNMEVLLIKALEQGVVFEVNQRSNALTGVAPDSDEHPIALARQGKIPALMDRPDLVAKLNDEMAICTDDPVVAGGGNLNAQELARMDISTGGMGRGSAREVLADQWGAMMTRWAMR